MGVRIKTLLKLSFKFCLVGRKKNQFEIGNISMSMLCKYSFIILRILQQVIDLLEHEISLKGEKEESRRTMLQAGRMNLTMCLLKSGDWIEARDLCEKVSAL